MPKRILIVEDDPGTRSALSRLLQCQGCSVRAFSSVEEVNGIMEACDFELAILDIRLPGRRGDDFGKELWDLCRKPIIFISGEYGFHHLHELFPNPVFMQKPLQVHQFLERVDEALAQAQ